ncbi:hypothetical protein [Nocardia gipuzkoensis]
MTAKTGYENAGPDNQVEQRQGKQPAFPSAEISPDLRDLATRVKAEAEKNRVTIEVTEEQLDSIKAIWTERDRSVPATVTFFVKGRPAAEMSVAGYSYTDNICCA